MVQGWGEATSYGGEIFQQLCLNFLYSLWKMNMLHYIFGETNWKLQVSVQWYSYYCHLIYMDWNKHIENWKPIFASHRHAALLYFRPIWLYWYAVHKSWLIVKFIFYVDKNCSSSKQWKLHNVDIKWQRKITF